MSPSVNDIAQRIGRNLQPGDVLIDDRYDMGNRYYEVLETGVAWAPPQGYISRRLFPKGDIGIKIRELTPHGPAEYNSIVRLSTDEWTDIVLLEKRTDRLSLKER